MSNRGMGEMSEDRVGDLVDTLMACVIMIHTDRRHESKTKEEVVEWVKQQLAENSFSTSDAPYIHLDSFNFHGPLHT
jgi:hypothetical protein